jgi:hypothetical protein
MESPDTWSVQRAVHLLAEMEGQSKGAKVRILSAILVNNEKLLTMGMWLGLNEAARLIEKQFPRAAERISKYRETIHSGVAPTEIERECRVAWAAAAEPDRPLLRYNGG